MSRVDATEFRRLMKQLRPVVRAAAARAVVAGAEVVARRARSLAPVDEGDLAASIQVKGKRLKSERPRGIALAKDAAAAPQEFGTGEIQEQEFMVPAAEEVEAAVRGQLIAAVRGAIR